MSAGGVVRVELIVAKTNESGGRDGAAATKPQSIDEVLL
jgi:hypothetical protein